MPAPGKKTTAVEEQSECLRVVRWQVGLEIAMRLSSLLMLIASAMGWIDVWQPTLIAYIFAANGGTGTLTGVGRQGLRPFSDVG